jgi:hypothetical protein
VSRSPLPVLSSCRSVVDRSRFVQVDSRAVSRILHREPQFAPPPLRTGPAPYHYFDGTAATAEWLFVLDTVNHCFWPEAEFPRWEVSYGNEVLSGYWALAASLKRAMEQGVTIHQAPTLNSLDAQTLARIFRGRGIIPLFQERLENLREAGRILIERFQGSFLHLIEEARGSALDLVLLLVKEFPSFNDIALYEGKTIHFYKRAQLLALDLWSTFRGTSWGNFVDIYELTAFADYKLPQVLRHLGIIFYTPELAAHVDSLIPLAAGSAEEVEIRAATVWSVEWLRRALVGRGLETTSAQLDSWLWNLGQQQPYREKPYHRTRTIFY